MDALTENTVGSPSRGTFSTYNFLAASHIANTTDIVVLTIRVARIGPFPPYDQEKSRKYIQYIVAFINEVCPSSAVLNIY